MGLAPSRWQYRIGGIWCGFLLWKHAQDVRQASVSTLGVLPSALREWFLDHPEVEMSAAAPATRYVPSPWTVIYPTILGHDGDHDPSSIRCDHDGLMDW